MLKGLFEREVDGPTRRSDFHRRYAEMTIARVAGDVAQLRRARRACEAERRRLRARGGGEVREEDDEEDERLLMEERTLSQLIRLREREIAEARRALKVERNERGRRQ